MMKRCGLWLLIAGLLLFGTACNAGNPPVPTAGTVSTTEAVDSTTETTSQTQESATETESAATTGSAVTTSRPNVTAPPTETPVTTQVRTTAGTTGTRPFHELYSDDRVWVTIKDEYVDFNRIYTAQDFPGVDIAEIRVINFENVRKQSVVIELAHPGEKEIYAAIEILSKNELSEAVSMDPLLYAD